MAFLSGIILVSAAKWAANEWKGASHEKRGLAIGIVAGAAILSVCGILRAFGKI